MRHNYVNDIGDYAKYAFLRALAGPASEPALRLGVNWYLTEHSETNADGRHRDHLGAPDRWAGLDEELLSAMCRIERSICGDASRLHISVIEEPASGVLPPSTLFFSEPLPDTMTLVPSGRRADRAAWADRSLEHLASADLVFCDPDNGFETKSASLGARTASKYTFFAEIAAYLEHDVPVVVYQHQARMRWDDQLAGIRNRMPPQWPLSAIRVLRFRAFGTRAFICLAPTSDSAARIDGALRRLAEGASGWEKAHLLVID